MKSLPEMEGWRERISPELLHEVESIGPYQVKGVLGEGGMGAVFFATQTEPVRRNVAIKILNANHLASGVMAMNRFQLERQALADMDHSGIAKVYEAGSTSHQNPYYIMEWVDGVPINVYCDEKKLNLDQRFDLVKLVAEAMQHAHQKGILHRDLKPANILVTEESGRAVPKVIDFGVAKKMGKESQLDSGSDELVGTPMYMSPEQIYGRTTDIDSRSDVYSLGVVMYELMTGHYPYEASLSSRYQLFGKIVSENPHLGSIRLKKSNRIGEIAEARSVKPRGLIKSISGDFDAIIDKALSKEPDKRYANMGALIADIKRHQRNWPVSPLWDHKPYVLKKFFLRNRFLAITALLVLGVLAFNVVTVQLAFNKQQVALDQAQQARQKADATIDYLERVLSSADPYKDGSQVRMIDLLEKASYGLSQDLEGQPEVEQAVRRTLGNTYLELGFYDKAEYELKIAAGLCDRLYGPNHLETLVVENMLGRILYKKGLYPESAQVHQHAVDKLTELFGETHTQTLWAEYNLAKAMDKKGEFQAASELFRRNLELRRSQFGLEHPTTLITINSLSLTLAKLGRLSEAESLLTQNMERLERVLGPEHPNTLNSMANLSVIYTDQEKFSEALLWAKTCLSIQQRVLGQNHPETLVSMDLLGDIYFSKNELEVAQEFYQETYESRKKVLGETHPLSIKSRLNLGLCLAKQGKEKEALEHFQPAIPLARKNLESATYLVRPLTLYASDLTRRKQFEEAENLLESCFSYQGKLSKQEVSTLMNSFEALYQEWGKPERAAAFAAKFRM